MKSNEKKDIEDIYDMKETLERDTSNQNEN